jgi:hypothetical protein
MRWAVEYSYTIEVEAPSQLDASELASLLIADGFDSGKIRVVDLFQHEPELIPDWREI